MLALCCSQLQTLAQTALTRLVSDGVVMHKSLDRGALQEQHTRRVASRSFKAKTGLFAGDIHILRLQTGDISHWLGASSNLWDHVIYFCQGSAFGFHSIPVFQRKEEPDDTFYLKDTQPYSIQPQGAQPFLPCCALTHADKGSSSLARLLM